MVKVCMNEGYSIAVEISGLFCLGIEFRVGLRTNSQVMSNNQPRIMLFQYSILLYGVLAKNVSKNNDYIFCAFTIAVTVWTLIFTL